MPTPRETQTSNESLYALEEEQGIRRGWLRGSLSVPILILTACLILFIGVVTFVCYNSLRSELTGYTRDAVTYLTDYAPRDPAARQEGARSYVADFSRRTVMEIQYLDADGALIASSVGRSTGVYPQTRDVIQALTGGRTAVWQGRDRFTQESVMAVSSAFVTENGEVTGVIRCISSLRPVHLRILQWTCAALALFLLILVLIYIANRRFEQSLMVPIRQINDTAQMIADGMYGVHIDPVYPKEIGELCRTLNNMSDAISHTEQLKNDFISSVSHELRTPLTAIGGWGETLLAGGAGESEETRRGLTIITNESSRLARMVEELLDFSRMENGNLTMRMERIDLTPDIQDVVFMYMDSIRREGIVLEYDEADELPEIIGDRGRLRQVFLNLLDNAIKHGGEGKRVRVEAYSEAQTLVISVRDYGAGIPADELAHVKERFYKGSSKARGSGIGLAIADEIMKLHGGRLDIQSVVGEGTVATMVLPAIIGDPDTEML